MSVSSEVVQVLIVLLPGFVTARLIQSLTTRKPQPELDKIVEALIYSFVVYSQFVLVFKRHPLTAVLRSEGDSPSAQGYSLQFVPVDVGWLLVFALGLGLLVAGSINNDVHTRFLRWLRITRKTPRPSVWLDVFHHFQGARAEYVLVELEDGRNLYGWPRYYANTPEEGALFLERASWILEDGKEIPIEGPGILISQNVRIKTVSFIASRSNAQTRSLGEIDD